MHTEIILSVNTTELLRQFNSAKYPVHNRPPDSHTISSETFTELLKLDFIDGSNQIDKDILKLQNALIEDFFSTHQLTPPPQHNRQLSWKIPRPLFLLLGGAGVLNAALAGFNGIASVISIFTSNLALAILPGLVFATIAAVIFVGFDFSQAANNIGIKVFKDRRVLGDMLKKQKQLQHFLNSTDALMTTMATRQSIGDLKSLLKVIDKQVQSVNTFSYALNDTLTAPSKFNKFKKACGVFCGALFLFGGFFCGQAGAMFLLGEVSMVAAMSTPAGLALVLILGCLSAVGAVSFYSMVQRPAVESLIGKFVGFTPETVASLTDGNTIGLLAQQSSMKCRLINGFTVQDSSTAAAPTIIFQGNMSASVFNDTIIDISPKS